MDNKSKTVEMSSYSPKIHEKVERNFITVLLTVKTWNIPRQLIKM